jgi:hypothetical protein
MTVAIDSSPDIAFPENRLSGTARSHAIDRWIFVFTAVSFIAIVLTGFVPDSFEKLAAIQAGQRPPFPPVLHVHAVLMGSFLLLLLAQSTLVALDKCAWHMQLGIAGMILAPAIVVTGSILVPTIYHTVWNASQMAPAPVRLQMQRTLPILDDIFLLQMRVGLVFAACMTIALWSRLRNSGTHKRLIFLAVATALPAAFDRIEWLPTTMPGSPLAADIYMVLAFSPMLVWDLIRNRSLHRAYVIWAAIFLPLTVPVYLLWDTPWWHAIAPRIMGV